MEGGLGPSLALFSMSSRSQSSVRTPSLAVARAEVSFRDAMNRWDNLALPRDPSAAGNLLEEILTAKVRGHYSFFSRFDSLV